MKLVSLTTGAVEGGAERYAFSIAAAASRQGWSVESGIPHAPGTAGLRRKYADASIATHPIPFVDGRDDQGGASRRDILRATHAVHRLLAKLRPDVAHVTIPWPSHGLANILAPALRGIPAVVAFQLVPAEFSVGNRVHLYRWASGRQSWVAVSDHGRSALEASLGLAQAVTVIPNGAQIPAAPASADERRAARISILSELRLPDAAELVLNVGRLHVQKGQKDLLLAIARIAPQRPLTHLLLAGEGPLRAELEALATELGIADRVHLLGHRSDVQRFVTGSDLFAFPSHFEGLPFAMIEALALGLPVVTADYPGVREIVVADRDALIVPVADPEGLARAIEQLLGDGRLAGRLGRAAPDRAREFSEERMFDRTLAELSAAAGRDAA